MPRAAQRGLGDRPQAVVGGGVDQQEVEPVADAQAVGRVGDEPGDVRLGRAGVEVEHAAAVGVGEHAGARGGAERGELPGDVAAAAHDDERHELGQADQRVGARVAGGGHELHRLGGHAVGRERRGDHVLDEGLRAAQRGRARAQDGRAAGLEHLRRHVDRDVGPGLEHRADHADGHAALVHPLPRRQVADEHLQRRLGGGGEDVELGGHVGEALGGEAETVEQALRPCRPPRRPRRRRGWRRAGPRPARAGARRRRAARRRSPGHPRPGRPARPRRRAGRPRGRRPARGCACRRRRSSRAQPATAVGPAPPRPNPTSQRRSLPHRGRGAGAEHLRPTCPPTPPRRGHGRHAEAAAPVRSTRNLRGAPPGCGDG